jgi:hypothetical protein
MMAPDCPAMLVTWARLCALALSPPSLMTISTFLSRLPFGRSPRALIFAGAGFT